VLLNWGEHFSTTNINININLKKNYGLHFTKDLYSRKDILFSGVTSPPLTITSRPSLGGENQI
jgi:hypothetical protein